MIAIYAISDCYGGAEVLLIRFSNYLRNKNISFLLVTKKTSVLAHKLSWAPQIEQNEIPKYKDSITHIFIPNISGFKFDIGLNGFDNPMVLSWIIHPSELYSSYFPCTERLLEILGCRSSWWIKKIFYRHNLNLVKMLKIMIDSGGLLAMDGATSRGLRYFYPELNYSAVAIVPIPSVIESVSAKSHINEAALAIGYLGRMDAFKLSAAKSFIQENLSGISKSKKVEFHFIGGGDCVNRLASVCRSAGVVFINHGFQYGSDAKLILKTKTNLVVAMGTAALDIAGAEHPCILIDPAFKTWAKPQKLFRFVHEIEGYTLGEFRDSKGYKAGIHTFKEVLCLVDDNPLIGKLGADYVKKNHDQDVVFRRLLHYIINSKCELRDVIPLSKKVAIAYEQINKRLRVAFKPIILLLEITGKFFR